MKDVTLRLDFATRAYNRMSPPICYFARMGLRAIRWWPTPGRSAAISAMTIILA
jgi:hypothetical protein